jgi:hypothetical protein
MTCLALAWTAAKPIYESGEPERALKRAIAATGLPRPEPLAPTALACVGLTEGDIIAARTVIAAYNRSNGLNLMALAAFVASPPVGLVHQASMRGWRRSGAIWPIGQRFSH